MSTKAFNFLFHSYVNIEFYLSGERGKLDNTLYRINVNITGTMYSFFFSSLFLSIKNQPLLSSSLFF